MRAENFRCSRSLSLVSVSGKGRKHTFVIMFLHCPSMTSSPHDCSDKNIDLSQTIFAVYMLIALTSSLRHRCKHRCDRYDYIETRL